MSEFVHTEVRQGVGMITLARPKALNALNLDMVRALLGTLHQWQADPSIAAVALRGSDKNGPFGQFCAGGDIRFFHEAALAGNPALEDFFTEEYALNHLTHHLGKPFIAFLDGIVYGGGMGLCQGASHRLVTANTKMAMPETLIGLFADVGGGYFLSRCPGASGAWLAMTGQAIPAAQAIALGLADHWIDASQQPAAWDALPALPNFEAATLQAWIAQYAPTDTPVHAAGEEGAGIDKHFSQPTVAAICASLQADPDPWAQATLAGLRKRSPLMLHVALEHVRRAAGVAEGANLVVEGVPVAAEDMPARDHDVDFFSSRCHTRPDLGDPCGKWRQASGEAGADGGHRIPESPSASTAVGTSWW